MIYIQGGTCLWYKRYVIKCFFYFSQNEPDLSYVLCGKLYMVEIKYYIWIGLLCKLGLQIEPSFLNWVF